MKPFAFLFCASALACVAPAPKGLRIAPRPEAQKAVVPEKEQPEGRSFVPIASVNDRAIDVSGLVGLWVHRESRRAFELLEHLIGRELIRAESHRLGLRVDAEAVDTRYADERRRLAQEAQRQAPGTALDDFIWTSFGLNPERYLDRVRSDVGWQLTAERVVRAWMLSSDRALCRLIVVSTKEDAEAVESGLTAGMDFGELARKYSVDDSAEREGRIAPIVRSETTPIAQLAFATGVGSVAGPLEERGTTFFLRVDERPETLAGSWSEVGEKVLASLAEEPVGEQEFLQWKLAMEAEHHIDRSGFLDLIGEMGD